MDVDCESPSTLVPKISAHELCIGPNTLLVDCRSLALFEQSHLRTATSLAFPPMLWRRILKQKSRPNCLDDFLMSSTQILRRRHDPGMQVILYDEGTRDVGDATEGSPLRELCDMLLLEKTTAFAFLQGGFKAAEALRPELVVKNTPITTAPCALSLPQLNLPSPAWRDSLFLPVSFIWGFMAIGGETNAHDVGFLERERITHVLNLTPTPCVPAALARCKCKQIELHDSQSQDLLSILPKAIEFIHAARMSHGRILVHCLAGISRSSAVAIAYVMWQGRLSLPEAYDVVRAHRQCASPNLNFMGQLMIFGKCLCSSVLSSSSSAFKRPRTAHTSAASSMAVSSSSSVFPGASVSALLDADSCSSSESGDAVSMGSGSESSSPTTSMVSGGSSSLGGCGRGAGGSGSGSGLCLESLSSGSSVASYTDGSEEGLMSAGSAPTIVGTSAAGAGGAGAGAGANFGSGSGPGSDLNAGIGAGPAVGFASSLHPLRAASLSLPMLSATGSTDSLPSSVSSSPTNPLYPPSAAAAAAAALPHNLLNGCTPAQAALLATVCLRKANSPMRSPLPTPATIMAKT